MQQWGCDTCHVMYPAQPVAQPFAMAMQPKRSGKKLVMAISITAIVGAGAAITLIAMQHKKPGATATAPVAASGSDPSIEIVPDTSAPSAKKPVVAPPAPPAPVVPRDTTLGAPEQMELADLWLWPRKDGSYLIASPIFEVVFPHRPTAKVEPAPHFNLDTYTLADDLQGRGLLQLQLTSLGRNTKDAGILETTKALVAKLGPVTETHRTDRGVEVTRLEATSPTTGESVRVDARIDGPRGILAIAMASVIPSDKATAEAFLDGIHTRPALDPLDDPKSLTVRVRKEHGKSQAHDTTDSFTIELPWTTKVSRAPDPHVVGVSVESTRGKASATLAIEEVSSWDALAFSPTKQRAFVEQAKTTFAATTGLAVKQATEKLGGLQAMRFDAKGGGHSYHLHLVWNRYQHRRYSLMCVDAPCDVIALSLKFAAPAPGH